MTLPVQHTLTLHLGKKKTLGIKFFIGKLVRGKSARRAKQFGLMKGNVLIQRK